MAFKKSSISHWSDKDNCSKIDSIYQVKGTAMHLIGEVTDNMETYWSHVYNPLLHNNAFWRLWNIMYLKVLWKMEHLLFWSKSSIFNNIFKNIQN